jgi:ribosomal protein S18 acetylase RimI-like enzyme
MEVTVQRFDIERVDECVDLYMKTYSREPWNESWESRDVVTALFMNHYKNNYFIGYMAIKDEMVVGVSLGFTKPWIKGLEYYIDEFFIDPDCQRQGIGSKLMSDIKKDLIPMNIHAIILVTKRGYPAHTFYEKEGFNVLENLIFLGMEF